MAIRRYAPGPYNDESSTKEFLNFLVNVDFFSVYILYCQSEQKIWYNWKQPVLFTKNGKPFQVTFPYI